jgi:hypothetical protein
MKLAALYPEGKKRMDPLIIKQRRAVNLQIY